MSQENILLEDKEFLNNFLNCLLYEQNSKYLIEQVEYFDYHPYYDDINLIIRPQCNQKCSYCYIAQHGDELYPTKLDRNETLKNVDLLLKYLYNNKRLFPYNFHLFAGDLFYDDIFFDILDIFEKHFKNIQKKYPELFIKNNKFVNTTQDSIKIIIPSNLSFVYEYPQKAEKVIEYFNKFLDLYNVRISFSWSTDGLYAITNREKKSLTQDYFDKILDFCIKLEVGPHPMIAPENIDTWKENYDWWLKMNEKLNEGTNHFGDFQPMLLEVRNHYWTDEQIDSYLDFLDYAMEIRYKKCGEDIDKLAYHLFNAYDRDVNKNPLYLNQYDFLSIKWIEEEDPHVERQGCALFQGINLNCTNLSLVLCHRLTYKHLTAAYFITNDEGTEIIDLVPQNPTIYTAIKTAKHLWYPKCYNCAIKNVCLKGCLGANFEYSGEPMLAPPQICKLFKRKIYHLLDLYEKYGVLKTAISKGYIKNDDFISWILFFRNPDNRLEDK